MGEEAHLALCTPINLICNMLDCKLFFLYTMFYFVLMSSSSCFVTNKEVQEFYRRTVFSPLLTTSILQVLYNR